MHPEETNESPVCSGVLGLLEAKDSVTFQKTPEGSNHLVSLLPLLSPLQGQTPTFSLGQECGPEGEGTNKEKGVVL